MILDEGAKMKWSRYANRFKIFLKKHRQLEEKRVDKINTMNDRLDAIKYALA